MGTRSSALGLFVLSLVVFGLQSLVLPAFPGRDLSRYVQTFVQLPYNDILLPSVMNTRGPLASLGVGLPLEAGGVAAEVWLALLYAASIVAWGAVALTFGKRAALLTTGLLLVYPGYGILFHALGGDSLFAATFAGWAYLLTRAMIRPSVPWFLAAGFGMGLLVLVRPSNQVLVIVALAPLFVRAPWLDRVRWVAAFFVASVVPTQGWKAIAAWRYGDAVSLRPSTAVLAVAAMFLAFLLLPRRWQRRAALLAAPALVMLLAAAVASGRNPIDSVRTVAQIPGGNQFVFRVFEIDPIASPDNGPASRTLARVVQRDLLTVEPYRSYGVTLDQVFTSGSDRIFGDLGSLEGVDLPAVANEAIRRHPWTFTSGIAATIWDMFWTRHVYAPEAGAQSASASGVLPSPSGAQTTNAVAGRKLPRPTDGQPIPSSHFLPVLRASGRAVGQVWLSATRSAYVFAHARDERRLAKFDRDTARLTSRIPARSANQALVHRLNQTSHVFPGPAFWLLLGLVALAVRRPRHSLVALAPSVAALVVIVPTSLVAFAVAEYAAPVSPAFILLAAVGLVGADPRMRSRLPSSGRGGRWE